MAFSPDGEMLLSGGLDGNVFEWKLPVKGTSVVNRGKESTLPAELRTLLPNDASPNLHAVIDLLVGVFQGSQPAIQSGLKILQRTNASKAIPAAVTKGAPGTIDLDRLKNQRQTATEHKIPRNVQSVAYSSSGDWFAAGEAGDDATDIEVHNRRTGDKKILKGHRGGVLSVAFNPKDNTLVSAGADGTVRLWDIDRETEIRKFEGHRSRVTGVAFSPDGKTLASSSHDETVRLWNVENGSQIRSIDHDSKVNGVVFSPNGEMLASTAGAYVYFWKTANGERIKSLKSHDAGSLAIAISPDGKKFVHQCSGCSATWIVDLTNWQNLREFKTGSEKVNSFQFSPDGLVLAVSGDQAVQLFDVETGKEIKKFDEPQGKVQSLAFDSADKTLLAGSFDKTVREWKLPVHEPPAPPAPKGDEPTVAELLRSLTAQYPTLRAITGYVDTNRGKSPSTLAWLWERISPASDPTKLIRKWGPRESWILAVVVGAITPALFVSGASWTSLILFPAILGAIWGLVHIFGMFEVNEDGRIQRIAGYRALFPSVKKAVIGAVWLTAFSFLLIGGTALLFTNTDPNILSVLQAGLLGFSASSVIGFVPMWIHRRSNERRLENKMQEAYDLMPEIEPLGLADVGEAIIENRHHNPHKRGLTILEVGDDQAINNAFAFLRQLSADGQTEISEGVVLVAMNDSIKKKIEKIPGQVSIPVAVVSKGELGETTDLAKVLETVLNGDLTAFGQAMVSRQLDIRLIAATKNWSASPFFVVSGRQVDVSTLSIRVYFARLVLDLVRDMGLMRDINAFFEQLRANHRATEQAA